jgi:hypothetical protein
MVELFAGIFIPDIVSIKKMMLCARLSYSKQFVKDVFTYKYEINFYLTVNIKYTV